MIPPKLAALFPADVRFRGDAYLDRVRIVSVDDFAIVARVRGTRDYAVEVAAYPPEVIVECSCPYASDYGPCKHAWAVLQQSDADGTLEVVLASAGRKPKFHCEPGSLDDAHLDDDDAYLDDDGARLDDNQPLLSVHTREPARRPPKRPAPPQWKRIFESAGQQMRYYDPEHAQASSAWPNERRLVYIVDLDATSQADGVVVHLGTEKRRKDGTWDLPKNFGLGAARWFAHPDPQDRLIAPMLLGATAPSFYGSTRTSGFVVRARALDPTLRLICETGRCRVRSGGEFLPNALRWDAGAPWQFRLRVVRNHPNAYTLVGVLRRDTEELPLVEPLQIHRDGFFFTQTALARFDHGGAFPLAAELRVAKVITVEDSALAEVLEAVHALPHAPAVELPPDAGFRLASVEPQPCVTIGSDPEPWRTRGSSSLVSLGFRYGALRTVAGEARKTLFDTEAGIMYHRQPDRETAARQRLTALGIGEEYDYRAGRKRLIVPRGKLAVLIQQLLHEGWYVDADGASYRVAGVPRAVVRSGIDWFDLDASVSYGEIAVPLAELLEARRRGEETISLADGSLGLLPLEWLARLGPLAATGRSDNGLTRFRKSQVALLDAILGTMPDVSVDATFERARAELQRFDSVEAAAPPSTFTGELREYQRDGLGWLHFLRRFGLGGCLADDMGLGKTVQVLALLDARRLEKAGPSIVVVPRSLVFNWIREAERFTPALRVVDYSGTGRDAKSIDPAAVDVVLTTYGTLRRDAPVLSGIEFEYAILDEAQAIKNAGTASAKAARLLRARHRLALSGTPIENRIDELWSLFEFLNPGMLGTASHFTSLARLASLSAADAPTAEHSLGNGAETAGRELLARALRPVILRRTKEKVASELPPRVEQTLEVELEPRQRKFYDALRAAYRQSVFTRIDRFGIKRARMHILEALLRLRQAACHPVLADSRQARLPSAKLDALLPALTEVVAEGHKALVFSQFTSFLALVRERMEKEDIPYEYLDGQVRDRQSRVDRFQSDVKCPVFLISLRAGGHGLNLTAADYVFILDPWWNPAVEAQAIDRTHRIGQTRRVIATRLVARNTIEEKILELQAAKRSLADAILSADAGVLSAIGRAELELLLG
ncbi:MAG: DEAD/DEAH box helicase [Gemmatimonadaceae bacterium]